MAKKKKIPVINAGSGIKGFKSGGSGGGSGLIVQRKPTALKSSAKAKSGSGH